MDAFAIIEKHLKEATEKQEAANKKVMADSATASDWSEYMETLAVYIALRAVYLDVLENELKTFKEYLCKN